MRELAAGYAYAAAVGGGGIVQNAARRMKTANWTREFQADIYNRLNELLSDLIVRETMVAPGRAPAEKEKTAV